MNLYKKGNLAKSLAGRDRDQIFVIVKEEGQYVYVADGRGRLLEKPKRKNKKHIQPICCSRELMPDIKNDEAVKRVIKLFCVGEDITADTRE